MDSSVQFVADIPRNYDRFLGPFFFAPYAQELAKRVAAKRPRRVLEVACGTGILTDHLRHALTHDAALTATDLNAPMIEYARSKLGDHRITWREADGTRLPFADHAFDAVVCQFGYMFFPDKVAGFLEAARVLTPTGTFWFSVWSSLVENPSGWIPHQTTLPAFETNPSQFYRVVFGYYDEVIIREHLKAAGFNAVQIDRVKLEGEAPSAAGLATGLLRGSPLYNMLVERGANVDRLELEVARRLADVGGSSPVKLPLDAKVITARLDAVH
jgi:ubiquinone/menaquinone biosynthesis C-methylase UbiE